MKVKAALAMAAVILAAGAGVLWTKWGSKLGRVGVAADKGLGRLEKMKPLEEFLEESGLWRAERLKLPSGEVVQVKPKRLVIRWVDKPRAYFVQGKLVDGAYSMSADAAVKSGTVEVQLYVNKKLVEEEVVELEKQKPFLELVILTIDKMANPDANLQQLSKISVDHYVKYKSKGFFRVR